MIRNDVQDIRLRVKLRARVCDFCQRSDDETAPPQVFAREGATDVYEASRPPLEGWNTLHIRVGTKTADFDVCPPCTARAVLALKAAASQPASVAPSQATPHVVSIDAAGRTTATAQAQAEEPTTATPADPPREAVGIEPAAPASTIEAPDAAASNGSGDAPGKAASPVVAIESAREKKKAKAVEKDDKPASETTTPGSDDGGAEG